MGLAIFLCTCNHPIAPCDGFTNGDYFNDTQADISVEICLLSFCQWIGTGIGEWYAVGLAAYSIINFMGGPSIMGSAWCSHVLNVLDL